jgi:hypothetical protein
MFLVAAHNIIRFRRQGAFQNHFVAGIGRRPRGAFCGENQFRRFGQGVNPFNRVA